MKKLLFVILLLIIVVLLMRFRQGNLGGKPLAPSIPKACPEVLPYVTYWLREACNVFDGPDKTACYGNSQLNASFRDPDFDSTQFDSQGERTALTQLASLETGAYDDLTKEWGIAVLRLRAYLEGSYSDEVVTMVVYGETDVEHDSSTPVELKKGIAGLEHFPAFYFSTRLGTARDCNVLPEGGVVIETPDDMQVALTANGVNITLGSTAVLQSNSNRMTVTVVDGTAQVRVGNQSRTVQAFEKIDIVMASGGRRPLRFANNATRVTLTHMNDLGQGALCQIAAALNLTFPCTISPSQSVSSNPTRTARPAAPTRTSRPREIVCRGTVTGATSGLRVRSQPNSSGQILQVLNTGDRIRILGQSDRTSGCASWYEINDPAVGWVCAGDLGPWITLESSCTSLGIEPPMWNTGRVAEPESPSKDPDVVIITPTNTQPPLVAVPVNPQQPQYKPVTGVYITANEPNNALTGGGGEYQLNIYQGCESSKTVTFIPNYQGDANSVDWTINETGTGIVYNMPANNKNRAKYSFSTQDYFVITLTVYDHFGVSSTATAGLQTYLVPC